MPITAAHPNLPIDGAARVLVGGLAAAWLARRCLAAAGASVDASIEEAGRWISDDGDGSSVESAPGHARILNDVATTVLGNLYDQRMSSRCP